MPGRRTGLVFFISGRDYSIIHFVTRINELDQHINRYYYSYKNPHQQEFVMRTIQMTLDDDLIESVDNIVRELKTTRSAFTRKALKQAITNMSLNQKEEKHRQGYAMKPVKKDEFGVWEGEQEWGDK